MMDKEVAQEFKRFVARAVFSRPAQGNSVPCQSIVVEEGIVGDLV